MDLSSIKLTGKPKARAREFSELVNNNLVPLDCLLCGSSNDAIEVFSTKDRYGFYYPTGICRHCGNIQQAEYYCEEHLQAFYEDFYRDIYGGLAPAELFDHQYLRGKDVYEFCKEDIKGLKNTILEIGTGSGGILARFHDEGFQTCGLDLDERYMSFARQKGLSIQFGNIESIGPDECDFGLIIVCHVLEHIVDPKKFLIRTAQHLSESGLLFVEVPMIDGVLAGDYRGLLGRYFQNAHVTHFSTKSLISMLEQAGLRVVKADSFGRVLAVKNNTEEVNSPVSLLEHQKSLLADLLSLQSNYFGKNPLKSVIYFLYDLVKPLFKR